MLISRVLQSQIELKMFKGKIIIVYGARQVGKTTLVRSIQEKYPKKSIYLNCDEPDIREAFTNKTSTEIRDYIGKNKLIILDEAQRVKNIGISLKLIADNYPDIQIIATGSSSFELSNDIIEPLTGRKYEYHLYPLSTGELMGKFTPVEVKRLIESRMIYGMYPEVVLSGEDKGETLSSITKSYLYRDILSYQRIKHSDALEKLLQALALQIGSEVSYTELGQVVGLDKKTVESYIQILEKSFIIFRISPFRRNLRNELKKLRKIYFYDTGIRNAIIRNLNPINLRNDAGGLWENYIISERIKRNSNTGFSPNIYFWRDHQRREIDYLEEEGGKLRGYEIKLTGGKVRVPKIFLETYKNSKVDVIKMENFLDFIAGSNS